MPRVKEVSLPELNIKKFSLKPKDIEGEGRMF